MSVARIYFHVDMDAFFVSVEELFDPSLKGKPVVVGGRPNERGVVSAASYAARKFGVHSAMPLRTAYKLCPQAIFVEGHMERYREYSGRVFEVLQQFSPLVEMASIDEAYLDVSGTERLHGPPLAAAHKLHDSVRRATNLNCSIGAAASRLVAKIASDQAKPNGVLWIIPGREARFLAPLEVRRIPGVGKVTEHNLHACGIRKVGDLAALDQAYLEERFGQWGLAMAGKARGEDAGGWFDNEIGAGEILSRSAMSTRFRWTPPRRLHWMPHWCASPKWWPGVAGSRPVVTHGANQAPVYRFLDLHSVRTLDEATQIDAELAAAARAFFTGMDGEAHPPAGGLCAVAGGQRGPDQPAANEKTEAWRKTFVP